MKLKALLVGAALLAASALASAPAQAGGYYTGAFPTLPAASILGTELLPADMAAGIWPQNEAISTQALKTFSNGGAIVTATGASGAATANGERVFVTTESLTTAAGAVFTETLTDSSVSAASLMLCNVGNGTNSAGQPTIGTVTPGAGSAVIKVQNIHASAALNGTLTIACRISN